MLNIIRRTSVTIQLQISPTKNPRLDLMFCMAVKFDLSLYMNNIDWITG
jgi:hypothetical protein